MDPEVKSFGRGPRELTGAVDLISRYKLLPHHDFFCKRSLPLSISDTHYLHNVVGDTEIRKGEGMQLDQLIQNNSRDTNARIQPFDLDVLREAFQLRETTPVDLPPAEKGVPTIAGKSKSESKDKERKHKKHRDKDREKDREHKKHKHRHKDRSKDKDKDKDKDKKKDKSGHHDSSADQPKKHHEKVGKLLLLASDPANYNINVREITKKLRLSISLMVPLFITDIGEQTVNKSTSLR